MRRILGVAAILTGVASVSAAETSYRACGKDGQLAFFSFTEAGNFVEIKILGSEIEPFIRPANSALLIEVEEDVLVFGDDMVTLIQGSKLTQLDCYSMNAKYVAAFNAEASEMAAELEERLTEALAAIAAAKADATEMMTDRERHAALLAQANKELSAEQALSAESQRQVALLNEQVVELRRQINTDLSVENENLQGRLAEALVEVAAWRTEATALRASVELFTKRAVESERQVTLLNVQLVEARRQIDRLRTLLDLADRADAEAKVQIESLGAQLIVALEEVERLRLEAAN